ncbi:MAG: HAD-IB family hydrolase [Pontimonas sp.]|jgi:HAD superfamily hydrolase (TIGR01490 family)|nr:HAD-IB family hydrolase [Pontimonas sp.]MDP4816934.1 HAD-IB family hydrolase [Pontimonas sp.]MDP4899588.1 HAD-IB family hydrolase [Pontimonas sp.]
MTPPRNSSAGSARVLVFVDVDNTLVKGASIYMFAIEAWKSGFIKWHHVIPALFQQRYFIRKGETTKRVKSTRERAQALVAGHQVRDFEKVAESAWRRSIAPKVFPEMIERINHHKSQGHEIWLLTASPQSLASVMARDLTLTGAIGTTLEEKDGAFTGEIDGELLHGPLKAKAAVQHALESDVNLAHCYAYSDSAADIPLLESVGHPVAVNPDHTLLAHATELSWPILWPESTNRHQTQRSKKAEKNAGH